MSFDNCDNYVIGLISDLIKKKYDESMGPDIGVKAKLPPPSKAANRF